MPMLSQKYAAIAAATVAAGLGGVAIAGAANSTSTSTTGTTATQSAGKPRANNETALTGATLKSASDAAIAANTGATVERASTEDPADASKAAYEVHITKADGTRAEVLEDSSFSVLSTKADAGRGGPGGPGGHGHDGDRAGLTAVAKALGVTEAKLQAAVDAARPATSTTGRADHDAAQAAAIATSLGQSTADVQAVIDGVHQAGGPGRGRDRGHGDDTALVAALVKKFSVTTAKAQAAVDAAESAEQTGRQAERTAEYAAIAKSLGLSASDVQKAFEANRPAPGRR